MKFSDYRKIRSIVLLGLNPCENVSDEHKYRTLRLIVTFLPGNFLYSSRYIVMFNHIIIRMRVNDDTINISTEQVNIIVLYFFNSSE